MHWRPSARSGPLTAGQGDGEGQTKRKEKKDELTVEELRGRIDALQTAVATAREERSGLPKKVPLREIMDEKDIVRLEQERKRITDVINMAAYRAETELAALAGPSLGLHHQDEARTFLQKTFNLPEPTSSRTRRPEP